MDDADAAADNDDDDACAGLSNDRKKARDANRVVNLRLILRSILCRALVGGWVVDDGNRNDAECGGAMLEDGEDDVCPS